MANGNIDQHLRFDLENDPVKESKGKIKIKPPKTNASQPSLKGLAAAPKPAFNTKRG